MIDVHFLLFLVATSMQQLTDSFGAFSLHAGPVAVTAAWQGAILACGLAVCLRLAPRASAAHRFAIWAAGFGALVCLPFLPSLIGAFSSHGLPQGAGSAHGFVSPHNTTAPLLRLDPRWSLLLGALWILGSLIRAVSLGFHSVRLRKLWNSAMPIEDLDEAEGLFADRLPRGARICTTNELDRPAVIGFFAPRILIPDWLYAKLSRDELEHVVLHECQHLRRRDDWINLAQKLCLVLFPLNPALAWMERQLCSERESACDDGVVRATQAPRAYAACLASLAERGLEHSAAEALSLGAWQRRSELVHRVHRILRRTPGLGPVATTALLGTLSFGLMFGSVEFARCPQLVAFVPAPQVIAQQHAAAVLGDARFVDAGYGFDKRNASASRFRAIDTVAHVPDANAGSLHGTTGKRNSAKQSQTSQTMRVNAAAAPREVLLKADMPASQSAAVDSVSDPGSEQLPAQWVIFTTWEQVETPASSPSAAKHAANVQQDYDADSASGQTTRNTTVQRLILKIYPATGTGIASSSDSSSSNSGSSSDQPTAVPLRDGWFVFQL